MSGERRRGGVLSSSNRVAGFMPRLGARWRLGAVLSFDLELREFDAPELVHVAQADAVRGCRVVELVRVNADAKQRGPKQQRLDASLFVGSLLKKIPGIF